MSLAKELLFTKQQLAYPYTLTVGNDGNDTLGFARRNNYSFGNLEPVDFQDTTINLLTISYNLIPNSIHLRFMDSLPSSVVELMIEFQETNNSYKLRGVGDWDLFYTTASSIPDMKNHSTLHAKIYVSADTSWDD